MSKKLNFIILTVIVIISLICSAEYTFIESTNYSIDTGDTAWMIVASAFVLLMTPGLAFFYGGLVNRKNVISTMLQSFVALGVMSVLWVFIGFSLAFGESYHGIIGNPFTYFNFIIHPIHLLEGEVEEVMMVVNEVTDIVESKKELAENERQFRNHMQHSPVAMAILRGEDFKIELANNR